MDEDGTMARMPALEKFSEIHGIGICTIADLIEYRMRTESFVKKSAEAIIPTAIAGDFRIMVFENQVENLQHIVLVKGKIEPEKPILVRVHSECLTGEIFGSSRCDCAEKLDNSMKMIETEGCGVLLYIRQEGRGIGLINKVKAYAMLDKGIDETEVKKRLHLGLDMRHYGLGAQVLVQLGVKKMKLLTNNPKRMVGLQGYGLSITEQIPIATRLDVNDPCYLECKQLKTGAVLLETS
jgi:3,4-dihydroxy 2-butanone 4-phosphate synthase/GTP cyclohydrolase II